MFKKIIILGSLILATTVVFADEGGNSEDTLKLFSHDKVNVTPKTLSDYIDIQNYQARPLYDLYIGAQGGANFARLRRKYTQTIDSTPITKSSFSWSAYGFHGGVFAGFGKYFSDIFYLGTEISGTIGTLNYKKHQGDEKLEFKMNYNIAADLIPGIFVSKRVLIYGRAGAALGQLKLKVSAPSLFFTDSFTKYRLGVRGGLGLRIYLTSRIIMSTEYIFTLYSSAHDKYIWHQPPLKPHIFKNSFSLITNQINLGISLHAN